MGKIACLSLPSFEIQVLSTLANAEAISGLLRRFSVLKTVEDLAETFVCITSVMASAGILPKATICLFVCCFFLKLRQPVLPKL